MSFSREDLEGFVSSGTLNHLEVCFSRDGVEEGGARYVQHKLQLNRRPITDILFRQNGHLFVCG